MFGRVLGAFWVCQGCVLGVFWVSFGVFFVRFGDLSASGCVKVYQECVLGVSRVC